MTKKTIAVSVAAGFVGVTILAVSAAAYLISKALDEAFEDTYYL